MGSWVVLVLSGASESAVRGVRHSCVELELKLPPLMEERGGGSLFSLHLERERSKQRDWRRCSVEGRNRPLSCSPPRVWYESRRGVFLAAGWF